MKRSHLLLIVLLVVVCLAEAGVILFLRAQDRWQESAAGTTIERGRAIATRMGCFGCHGPGGTSPIANPGATYGEVPSWGSGQWMLFNDDARDVRAWITDGHPADRAPDDGALIPMPAYGDLLSDNELDDLVAFVLAVSRLAWDEPPAVAEGRELALRLGCLGCHGPEGRGLVWNPGSFKGFVPPWDGEDYPELVRDADEFRQWVRNGVSDRLRANPAARFFLGNQPIRMPAYGDRVSDEQLDALRAYVEWVRANPRTGESSR